MSNKAKGSSYEQFVLSVYNAINIAEASTKFQTIHIETNKKLVDRNGIERELDIYWEYSIFGHQYKTAIECKNYNSRVSIDKVEAFAQKLRSLSLSKGIMATQLGYQGGAKKTAEAEGISLIVVRETVDSDWDGYLRGINLEISARLAPVIDNSTLQVEPDREWFRKNMPNSDGKFSFHCFNNEVGIENYFEDKYYSFWDIENKILPRDKYGRHYWENEFENAYLVTRDFRFKILKLGFEYIGREPLISKMNVDFAAHTLAIVEYITDEQKKIIVTRDGSVKEFDSL
jgi:hypothetical protein